MKTLLKNGTVVNVFTGELENCDVLIDNNKIIGVGKYEDIDADSVENVSGKYICPGFIDGHIHIESTMLTPCELAKLCVPHGTTSIIADPHEIANVCGVKGIDFMLQASENIPMNVYFNIPSCVPATPYDESGAILDADSVKPLYSKNRIIGLGEMMNYPGVIFGDEDVHKKISDANKLNKPIDGHAPMLSGKDLDKYISSGIQTEHECSALDEAKEKLRKGQWIMIRQGTAARNLESLIGLFDEGFRHRCILVTDDRHPADIMKDGHIDNIIRLAVKMGKSPVTAIQMATIQAAQCFGLRFMGAIAPGYKADILVLDNLEEVSVKDVYFDGEKVDVGNIDAPKIDDNLNSAVLNSFHIDKLTESDFMIENKGERCRVIKVIPGELVTDELIENINWEKNNGVDLDNDILKLAVIERHHNTGHKGVGFIKGIGLKEGAIASSVAHDSHNLIVIGTNEKDMAIAANHICSVGGNVVVKNGEIIAEMQLPIAGLMSAKSGSDVAMENEAVRNAVYDLGVPDNIEPFMNMAFVSLPVIPSIKMTTQGLFDVVNQKRLSLYE